MKYSIIVLLIFSFLCTFTSCSEPHALYGTWADNRGNSISFYNDNNTFKAQISSGGLSVIYEGNFTVLLNALSLECTNVEYMVVTEWDIRGNILYLNWPAENDTIMLTLYKISN